MRLIMTDIQSAIYSWIKTKLKIKTKQNKNLKIKIKK